MSAQQISVDNAKKTALEFLTRTETIRKTKTAINAESLKLVYTGKTNDVVSFYVFNQENGGFVIAGGDEVSQPVLAYSETGVFDVNNINPNFKYWLEMYKKEIAAAKSAPLTSNLSSLNSNLSSKQDVPIIVQTRWDQESPYYNSIVSYTGKKYLTGCVATAMSQIMKTNEWPIQGSGSHTYTDTDYSKKTYTRDFSEHIYDWDNMLNTYTSSATTAQKNAVAELMFDAGVAVEMEYGTSSQGGSGAMTEDCAYAYATYFGYDKGVFHRYRDYYTLDEWSEIVYNELSQGRALMYGGCDTEGGHSFICDGYQASTDQYHFNWGWSGDSDCYCKLSAVKGGGYTWSYYQDIVAGIQKPVTGSKAKPYLILYDNCDMTITETSTSDGSTFTCKCGTYQYYDEYSKLQTEQGYIMNDAWKAFDCVFAMMYVNQTTGEKYIAKPTDLTSTKIAFPSVYPILKLELDVKSITLKNVTVPAMPEGTYRVYLAYKDKNDANDDSVEWEYVRGYSDNTYWMETEIESHVDAPEVLSATDITNTGFTANWEEVDDAQSYTLMLIAKEKEMKQDVTMLDEDFSGCKQSTTGTTDRGNDLDKYMKDEGWTGTKVYIGYNFVKLGTQSMGGQIITPTITADGEVTVVVNVSQYNTDNATITLNIGNESFSLTPSNEDQTFTADIKGDFNVTLSSTGSKQRFILSKVKVLIPGQKQESTTYENIKENKYVFTDLSDAYTYSYKVKVTTNEGVSPWSEEEEVTLTTGIDEGQERREERGETSAFNLAGQRVNKSYKGIIIHKGQKYIKNN